MLLFPKEISEEEKNEIFKAIAFAAKHPEKRIVTSTSTIEEVRLAKYLNSLLETCSIDQYKLPDIPGGKIVLSNKVYKRLYRYAYNSNDLDSSIMTEFGGYLYGKEYSANEVYFSNNNTAKADNSSCAFETPERLSKELQDIIAYTSYDCIAHVHTHPFLDGHYSLFPSNQDLYLYASLQENFNRSTRNVYFLGGLITPLTRPGSDIRMNDICFIFYDKNLSKFYKCDNIFYEDVNRNTKELPKVTYNYQDRGKTLFKQKRTLLQNPDNI